jgi:hypothetical protein
MCGLKRKGAYARAPDGVFFGLLRSFGAAHDRTQSRAVLAMDGQQRALLYVCQQIASEGSGVASSRQERMHVSAAACCDSVTPGSGAPAIIGEGDCPHKGKGAGLEKMPRDRGAF